MMEAQVRMIVNTLSTLQGLHKMLGSKVRLCVHRVLLVGLMSAGSSEGSGQRQMAHRNLVPSAGVPIRPK